MKPETESTTNFDKKTNKTGQFRRFSKKHNPRNTRQVEPAQTSEPTGNNAMICIMFGMALFVILIAGCLLGNLSHAVYYELFNQNKTDIRIVNLQTKISELEDFNSHVCDDITLLMETMELMKRSNVQKPVQAPKEDNEYKDFDVRYYSKRPHNY